MRIAVNGLFWGRSTTGSGQYTMELLKVLLAHYPEHRYLLLLHPASGLKPSAGEAGRTAQSPAETLTPEVTPGGLTTCSLPTPLDRLGANWAKLWFEQVTFPRFCRRQRADVAHVPYWASPLWSGLPTVVTIHDLIPLVLPAYRGSALVRLYSRLVAASARRAAYVVTDSEASRRDIIRLLPIPPDRVQTVYLAADESFRPVTDRTVLDVVRRKYGLPERYVLYLGGFDQRKNVAFLLQAYARLTREWSGAPYLVIAGRLPKNDTPFFPDPQRRAAELGLTGRTAFIGWVDEADKPALYSGAELFVFPSAYEGFGLPVLESLRCGTPAVVTDAGSLPEIAGDGGVQVPVGDLDGLCQAMGRVLREPAWRETLRQAGLDHSRHFTWERTAAKMAAVYGQLTRK